MEDWKDLYQKLRFRIKFVLSSTYSCFFLCLTEMSNKLYTYVSNIYTILETKEDFWKVESAWDAPIGKNIWYI